MHLIVGVDPGYTTGICAVRSDSSVYNAGLVRWETLTELWRTYAAEVAAHVERIVDGADTFTVKVEDIVAPNPHLGLSNPKHAINTARLIGYLEALYDCELVRPGKKGGRPLSEYPAALVADNEPKGTGKLRHARSAYDIALTTAVWQVQP